MRLLVLGFGNVDRRDDGVALHVINTLREQQGHSLIDPHDTDGLEERAAGATDGAVLDTGHVYQLTPDLAEIAADYDHVVFVDAHISTHEALIREVPVPPQARPGIVSHQLSPNTVLAMAHQLYGGHPAGTLLSIRAHDLDFGVGLSPQTAAGVAPAVARIWAIYQPSLSEP